MALKPCRECGHTVSTEAAACPQCGAVNPGWKAAKARPTGVNYRKNGPTFGSIIIVLMFVFAVIAGLSNEGTNKAPASGLTSTPTASQDALLNAASTSGQSKPSATTPSVSIFNNASARIVSSLKLHKSLDASDIPELNTLYHRDNVGFIDNIAGKIAFASGGRFAGFQRQSISKSLWQVSVFSDSQPSRQISCFYDYFDTVVSSIPIDARVRIDGFVGIPLGEGLMLSGNCNIIR